MALAAPRFTARIGQVGINPYVRVPVTVVRALLKTAQRTAGPIPVAGTLNGAVFSANVVRYGGMWRLYLNLGMRRAANADVGDDVSVVLHFDPIPRTVAVPPPLAQALARDSRAKAAFTQLTPSRQKELLRYLNQLKRADSLARNIEKALRFLRGESVQGLVALTRGKRVDA